MRQGPGSTSLRLGVLLEKDLQFTIVQDAKVAHGQTWFLVHLPKGKEGWVQPPPELAAFFSDKLAQRDSSPASAPTELEQEASTASTSSNEPASLSSLLSSAPLTSPSAGSNPNNALQRVVQEVVHGTDYDFADEEALHGLTHHDLLTLAQQQQHQQQHNPTDADADASATVLGSVADPSQWPDADTPGHNASTSWQNKPPAYQQQSRRQLVEEQLRDVRTALQEDIISGPMTQDDRKHNKALYQRRIRVARNLLSSHRRMVGQDPHLDARVLIAALSVAAHIPLHGWRGVLHTQGFRALCDQVSVCCGSFSISDLAAIQAALVALLKVCMLCVLCVCVLSACCVRVVCVCVCVVCACVLGCVCGCACVVRMSVCTYVCALYSSLLCFPATCDSFGCHLHDSGPR